MMITSARTPEQIPVRQEALLVKHKRSCNIASVYRWEVVGSTVRALLLSKQDRQQPVFRSHLYQFFVGQNNE